MAELDPDIVEIIDDAANGVLDFSIQNRLPWICADCSMTFWEGMPEECCYNDPQCNLLLKRDQPL